MDPTGDIRLNGRSYRVDLTSYREKDLADFSPRASVAGGSVAQSELMLYQPLYITDWRHGLGFLWHTDAMGYMTTMGNVDTRQPGIVMMFTDENVYSVPDNVYGDKIGMVKFNDKIYAWGSDGLRVFDPTTEKWLAVWDDAGVNCALVTEDYLFFSPSVTTTYRLQRMDKTGSIVDAGVDDAYNFKWMVIHKGRVYAGVSGSNWVHYSSDPELDDLSGDTTPAASGGGTVNDPVAIPVGFGGFGTLGAISFGTELYVFRPDGVWVIGEGDTSRRVLDYSGETSDANFAGATVFNGYLYYSVRNKVYQWNGSRVVDVTPPRFSDQFPYSEIRTIGPMVTANNFMYMIANWYNNPTETEITGIGTVGAIYTSLFCYDGVGWHKLSDLEDSGGQPRTSSMLIDGDDNKLYYFVSNLYATSRRISPFGSFNLGPTTLPASPYPDTSIRSEGQCIWVSSRLDMGFRRVDKFSPSVLIEASNLQDPGRDGLGDGRWLSISALLVGMPGRDSPVLVSLGTVVKSGVTELTFPGLGMYATRDRDVWGGPNERDTVLFASDPNTIVSDRERLLRDVLATPSEVTPTTQAVYKHVILIVQLHSTDTTQSPILEGITLRFLLRPDVFYGYNFNVVAATNMVHGDNMDVRTAGQIVNELKAMRNSKQPLHFVDIYGLEHQVYISSITNIGVEMHEESDLGKLNNVETLVNVNVVECK